MSVTYQTLPRRDYTIYDVIIPAQGEFVCDIPAGDGRKAFFTVNLISSETPQTPFLTVGTHTAYMYNIILYVVLKFYLGAIKSKKSVGSTFLRIKHCGGAAEKKSGSYIYNKYAEKYIKIRVIVLHAVFVS